MLFSLYSAPQPEMTFPNISKLLLPQYGIVNLTVCKFFKVANVLASSTVQAFVKSVPRQLSSLSSVRPETVEIN